VELEKNGVKVMASFLRDQLEVIGRGNLEPKYLRGGTESIGRLVRIMEGPHKSSLAEVKEVYDEAVQVQLKSSKAIIVLKRNHLTEVQLPTNYDSFNTNDSIPQTNHLLNMAGTNSWSQGVAANSNAVIAPLSANVSNSPQKEDEPSHHESWRQGKKRKRGRPRPKKGHAKISQTSSASKKVQAKISQASSGQKLTMSRNHFPYSQFTQWPPPIAASDPLPGNPAHREPPQIVGGRDSASLRPIGSYLNNSGYANDDINTGVSVPMPGLMDRNATTRDGVQSQSTSGILPEDEDTFRQYLRSVNQGRDHQSAGSSQHPQQASFSRRW